VGTVLDLFVTLHHPTSPLIGGFEVGIDMLAPLLVLGVEFPHDGWNFGGSFTNLLVGFPTPVPSGPDLTVLGTLRVLVVQPFEWCYYVVYHGATPPSVPGHDGPVYADGAVPDLLVPCGYVGGSSEVFWFNPGTPVEGWTYTAVKRLFR